MAIKKLGKMFGKAGKEIAKNVDDIADGAEEASKVLGKNAKNLANAKPGFRVGFEAVDEVLDNTALGQVFTKVEDIDSVDSFIQKGLPYTLTKNAALAYVGANLLKDSVDVGMKHHHNLKIGESQGFKKLSGMTDSILGPNNDSNMIVNPLIKAVMDTSSPEAYAKGERIMKGSQIDTLMRFNKTPRENLVFALHNLR